MACKVYETFGQEYPKPSPRYDMLFNALETINEASGEKTIRYALIDAFPETFTVDSTGNIMINGNVKDRNHTANIINATIGKYFGKGPLFNIEGQANGRLLADLNPIYFSDNLSAAREVFMPRIPEDLMNEQIHAGRARKFQAVETPEPKALPKKDKPFEDVPGLVDQLKHLKDTFASIGINITVKFDENLPVKGRVINKSETSADILLNPEMMSEDTHFHEFSHILIDLLGEDNKLVKEALALVNGTELHEQIKAEYKDLSEKAALHETLITAVGMRAALKVKQKQEIESRSRLLTGVNKFLRGLKNFFGLRDTAVDKLVDKLLSKRLNPIDFSETLRVGESKDSRELDRRVKDFNDMLDAAKETLQVQLDRLEALPVKNDNVIIDIKAQLKKLKEVKKVEDLTSFVDFLGRVVKTNASTLEYIQQHDFENLNEEERYQMQNSMYNLGNNIKDFFVGSTPENSIIRKLKDSILDRQEQLALRGKENAKLSSLEEKTVKLITQLERQHKYYNEIGLVIQADLLLEYNTPEINNQIDDVIEKYIDPEKGFGRLIDLKETDEVKKVRAQYKDKTITEEEFKKKLLDINKQQWLNKKIGRETIINELREAQTDKSWYSVMMDPIMYSSQVTLQLFASMVKNKLYQASADTRDVIDTLAPIYREYAASRGADLNPKNFNEPILETHVYYVEDPETGRKKRTEILTFVQPYDVTRYNQAEYDMLKKAAVDFEKPTNVEWDVYKAWKESSKGKGYRDAIATWYKENTNPTEEGALMLQDIKARLKDAQLQIKQYAPDKRTADADKYALYEASILDLKTQINRIYDGENNQFKGLAVRPNYKYRNPKHQALLDEAGNPKGVEGKYYKALLDVYHADQKACGSQIPITNTWEKLSYAVPSVEAEGFQKLQNDGFNVFSSAKDYLNREFTFLSTDDMYGMTINANKEQRNKIVPIFYTKPTDAKFVSHDVGSTIVLFSGMANMFKRKSEIHGSVIMMRDIVERRELLEVNAKNVPFVSAAAAKAGINRATRKGSVSNNFEHLSMFIDKIFFGEKEITTTVQLGDKVLSVNKVVNKLASFTALNQLALNFLQASNQFLIDNQKLAEEAIAGQYFKPKNLAWAKSLYTKLTLSGETVTDAGKFSPESKLSRFILEFDLLGTSLEDSREKKTGNRLAKGISKNGLFFMQHMAEHETAVTRGLAIADAYRGKLKDKDGNVIKNAEGKDANLWDLYNKNEKGKWELDPRVANYKKINFINMISGVYKKTNQIKTDFDDAMMHRQWYGKALLMYKRYFQPGLRKRWGYGDGIHVDLETDSLSEGMYISFVRYMRESFKKGMKFGAIYNTLMDVEKQNVKRTTAELAFLIAVTMIGSALVAMMKDDDDDGYVTPFLAYQALRMEAELAQFWNPKEFYRLIMSPTALSRPVVDGAILVDQLLTEELPYRTKLMLNLEITDEDLKAINYQKNSGRHLKGDSKTLAMFEKISPIVNGAESSMNPAEKLKFFTGTGGK